MPEPHYADRHRLQSAVWESETLRSDEAMLLLALSWYVNKPDGLAQVWATQRRLALMTKLRRPRVSDALARLEASGWLGVVARGRGRVATRYRINVTPGSAKAPETFGTELSTIGTPGRAISGTPGGARTDRTHRTSAREDADRCTVCGYSVAGCDQATRRSPGRCEGPADRAVALEHA